MPRRRCCKLYTRSKGYRMFYYYVWVKSVRYRGSEPLTYRYSAQLAVGSIVRVELRHEVVLGIITGATARPAFPTKLIDEKLDLPPLPGAILRLAAWLQRFYPAPIGVITQQFIPSLTKHQRLEAADSAAAPLSGDTAEPRLTKGQEEVL